MTDSERRLAGRYRIDGSPGRGGMSEVYFGYDERLHRPVAVKLLRPPSYVPAAPDSPEAVESLDALEDLLLPRRPTLARSRTSSTATCTARSRS